MSRNDEEKAVSIVSFISSSLWYIEDFSITEERKITHVAQRRHTKQTIGSFIACISTECSYISVTLPFIAWISTEYSYISLLNRLLREYPNNIVIFRYCLKIRYLLYLVFSKSNRCIQRIIQMQMYAILSGLEQNINTLFKFHSFSWYMHVISVACTVKATPQVR